MESSTWQLSCSRLAGSLWGGIAPEHQPAQPHSTATEGPTKFRESFYKIWRRPSPSRHFQSAPISVFLGILEKLSFDFVDSSTYMAPPSPWQSHSMVVAPPPPLTIILFQINWRCRRLSSIRTPPDTVSRLSSITALSTDLITINRATFVLTLSQCQIQTRALIAQICWPDKTHSAAKQRLQKRPSGGPSSSALTVSLLYRACHDIMDADAANTQNSWCPGPGPERRLPGPPRRV